MIGDGREIEDRPALSLTGAVLPGVKLKGTHLDAAQVPPVYAEPRVWEDLLHLTANQQPSFLMLADPFSFETETFVKGLDRVYPHAPKIGGLASGARQVGGTVLYLGNEVHHSGGITLALTGNIDIDTVVAQGCRPVGDPMFVTLAHENLIRELDGHSPRDVLAELFERLPSADRELFSQSLFLGLAMRTDAHAVRARRFPDPQHHGHGPAEWCAVGECECAGQQRGAVPSARRGDVCARSGTHADAATALRAASRAMPAHCFSSAAAAASACTASPITTAMPSADWSPTCRIGGFFCNGEIGPVQNATYLHGYTSAFAVFREKGLIQRADE